MKVTPWNFSFPGRLITSESLSKSHRGVYVKAVRSVGPETVITRLRKGTLPASTTTTRKFWPLASFVCNQVQQEKWYKL